MIMLIIPAIDLKDGKCVRLRQGRAEDVTVFGDDPAAMGLRWQEAGAQLLHVVDLDGAFSSRPQNLESIRRLRQALTIPIELGGGIRTLDTVAAYIELGIDRLILGTVALKDPGLAARACADYPGRIIFGLDAKDGLLAVEGWTETSQKTALDAAKALAQLNPAAFIYTDIARDGMQTGVNYGAYRALTTQISVPIIASGGVTTLDDIRHLRTLGAQIEGVIVGRALYERAFTLEDAIATGRGEGS